ncbi:testis-expressed protein 47 [Ambystoma mexicanum]|uniref:testis-expressed protein 47 n=1 Tax=Ambystoma mexicanum TaxID=8296 RepID=UPI0037E89B6E
MATSIPPNRFVMTPTTLQRPNLLGALEERRRGQQRKFIIHRLFYIAEKSQERIDFREITGYHERLFQTIIKSHLGEAISGLLLIYPNCIVHMLESSIDILYCVLQDLAELQNQGANQLLKNPKVLLISHNIQGRLFPQWYFRLINLPVMYFEDFGQDLNLETMLIDFLTMLLKLGAFFSKTAKIGSKGPGENLHDVAPQLLIREAIIMHLCASKAWLTPEQFLEHYTKPIQISMASDYIWPIPGHIYL